MNETQQDQYLQAQKLIAEEKWQEASDILEDLINEVDDSEIGRLTIIALYHSQQYTRACTYSRQEYQETLQTRLRDFYHLGDYSLEEQQSRLQAAFKLPLNEFITGAKFLLRDPYTHPLVKSSLVELLSKLRVADPVTVYWLDKKEYTVVPADIQPLNLLPVVSEGKRLITEKCGNQNPQTEKMAIQEFQLQVMFLYPRINQIIKDIDEWTDVLIARIEGKKVATNTVSSTWQERLGKQIDELIEKH